MKQGEIIKLKAAHTEADKIIRYLLNPEDPDCDLTESLKKKFDILKSVHSFRMRYYRKTDVIKILQELHNVSERQAYNYMQECEYVFGSTEGVHKAYERNFLLECSRKNIELSMNSRKPDLITKALMAHYRLCGLDEVIIDMPDFSALEPNNYTITLPPAQQVMLQGLLTKGLVNLNDVIPHQDITFDVPHVDVSDGKPGE